jgi:hypothetical protein
MHAGFMLSQMDELKSGAACWYPVGCCIFYVCIISSTISIYGRRALERSNQGCWIYQQVHSAPPETTKSDNF